MRAVDQHGRQRDRRTGDQSSRISHDLPAGWAPRADGHELLARGNPRQGEVDEEREQVAEQIGLREPIDFQSELLPPREP
jgi:hypothetical protein